MACFTMNKLHIHKNKANKTESFKFEQPKRVPSRCVSTESVGPRRTAAVSLSGACHVFSLYDSVVPNVCDSTAASCSAEGGVHSAPHFPAIFVKGDLTPLFLLQ